MTLRLLMIDDSEADRVLFKQMMLGTDSTSVNPSPWWRNVDLVMVAGPLPNMADYDAFDGIIVDFGLQGPVTGYDVAQQIHLHDWSKPIMLLTGYDPTHIPADAREWFDAIAFKLGTVKQRHLDDPYAVSRAFLRYISAIKKAKP